MRSAVSSTSSVCGPAAALPPCGRAGKLPAHRTRAAMAARLFMVDQSPPYSAALRFPQRGHCGFVLARGRFQLPGVNERVRSEPLWFRWTSAGSRSSMRTSAPPLTSWGTTRWTGPPKTRVSRGRRLLATGMAALGRWRSTARSDEETPYCSGRSLRTITSPPACGRNPMPVMAAWPFAGLRAGAARCATAGVVPSALSGRWDPTSDTVGSPARSRTSGISAGVWSEVEVAVVSVGVPLAVGAIVALGVAVAIGFAVGVAVAVGFAFGVVVVVAVAVGVAVVVCVAVVVGVVVAVRVGVAIGVAVVVGVVVAVRVGVAIGVAVVVGVVVAVGVGVAVGIAVVVVVVALVVA